LLGLNQNGTQNFMQVTTNRIEESSLPKSIVRIKVEKLFGKYTYTLSKRDNHLVDSSLIILYGNNGSGKTTILKLLFHLLSPNSVRDHLSFLAHTHFRKFSVVLADGTSITAARGDTTTGSFELQLIKNNNIFTENISVEDNKDNPKKFGKTLYKHLLELKLNLFFLGDDRKLESDIFEEAEYTGNTSTLNSVFTVSLLHALEEERNNINREISLKKSIKRTEEWMREQALKGTNQGAENAHTIYEEIISGIILSSNTVFQDELSNLSYKTLISGLEYYESKSQDFARFGLMVPLSTKKIANILQSHSQANHSIISSILKPYIDSIEARFDALEDTYKILTIFENTINELFFTDKFIRLNIKEGIKIFTDKGEELSSEILSSGEKQLLLLFCNTLIARDKATIFIIDEPEISLNIKWQRQLIRALLDLTKGSQVQFILATHSIELLSQYNNHVIKLQAVGE
jgi:energy-coupling factor transporter ATP-binding protein EcfA2